jgi:hypothetical protein
MSGKKTTFAPMIEGEVTGTKEEEFFPEATPPQEEATIIKPGDFSLDNFRSTKPAGLASVATLQTALPHHSLSEAKDFVRLHASDAYWSDELCFVSVPILGQKKSTMHLIVEDVATRHLQPPQILRFQLALAAKPHDNFFLCHVPSQRLDGMQQTGRRASRLKRCGRWPRP